MLPAYSFPSLILARTCFTAVGCMLKEEIRHNEGIYCSYALHRLAGEDKNINLYHRKIN